MGLVQSQEMQNVLIVGLGAWGLRLLATLEKCQECKILGAVDRNPNNQSNARKLFPSLRIENELSIDHWPNIELAVIATQANSHAALAKSFLQAKISLFIEKPFCVSLQEAEAVANLSLQKATEVYVDHTYLHSSNYGVFKAAFPKQGDLIYSSQRLDYGGFVSDVDIISHLAYHDLYILDDLIGLQNLEPVYAHEFRRKERQVSDAAKIQLKGSGNSTYWISVSTLFPEKVRKITAVWQNQSLLWDDQAQKITRKTYALGKSKASVHKEEKLLENPQASTPLERQFSQLFKNGYHDQSLMQSLRVKRFIEEIRGQMGGS